MENNLDQKTKTNEEQFPAVASAYEVSLKSYDWCIQRSDSIDSVIDRLLAWFSSITLGVVAIVATRNEVQYFESWFFYLAILLFLAIIGIGICAKWIGSLRLIDPSELFNKYLEYSVWEFQKNIIYWSGYDFSQNQDYVNWKGKCSIYIMFCFALEIIMLGIWLTTIGK